MSPDASTPRQQDRLTTRLTRATESLMEDESLTGDLPDSIALPLLAWGQTQVQTCVQATLDQEDERALATVDPCIALTRRTLRRISRLLSQRANLEASELAAALTDLVPNSRSHEPGISSLVSQQTSLDDSQFLAEVLAWLSSIPEAGSMPAGHSTP